MILVPQPVPGWPKLAWVAACARGAEAVRVYHGPRVEASDRHVVEAVWAGRFEDADFDRTDLVVGTGVRCRQDRIVFVSSGTAVDRLWHCEHAGLFYVANSLPALLAVANLSLAEDYAGYVTDIETIDEPHGGLSKYVRLYPAAGAALQVLYFANLVFDGRELREEPKPDTVPAMHAFREYDAFLRATAEAMGENAQSPARAHRVVLLTTVSSGYDSPAVAVIAKRAGCELAATITNATSLWRGSDSGEEIARRLGLTCRVYRHSPRRYDAEEAVWAALGRPRGLNMTVFDFPEPLCLFFTGTYGDRIWDRNCPDISEPTGDLSGLCLCEFRLLKGFFHCMPTWWGIRRSAQIRAINFSEEMEPWSLHSDYDRPIARRILEDAGIPRGSFAVRKKNTASESAFWWPYARGSQASFRQYVRSRGLFAPSPVVAALCRWGAGLGNFAYSNLVKVLGLRKRPRRWQRLKSRSMLFPWANHELKRRYRAALEGVSLGQPREVGGGKDRRA